MSDFTALQRDTLARQLRNHTRAEVRFDEATRRLYSTDASIYQIDPLGVVLPRSPEDVVAVVQICAEMQVPLTARGGGTSLSGQAIGPGVVLDCSRHLNQILDLDVTNRVARVQPGVVLDQINRRVAPHNLWFAPDVSTASRANLGGMIGNNSAGARSIVYGKTLDHVRRLSAVLSDGSRVVWGPTNPVEWERRAALTTLEGAIHRGVREVVTANGGEIRRRFPRILRRVSGYNLDVFCDTPEGNGRRGFPWPPFAPIYPHPGLHQLLVGSEGTLAVTTEAEVNLAPRPRHRGLLVPQFATLAAAMDALAVCLEFNPSAVELMDHLLLELTAGNLALRETTKLIQGKPQAIFMVEFASEEPGEVEDRVEKLRHRLRDVPGITALVPAIDPGVRDPLWDLRRASMPLLYGMRGDRKPVTFVEDPAVTPDRLPEFVARFKDVLHRHGTDGSFYGHASVGCLHIRPVLNLKDGEEVGRMRKIADEVSDLVLEFGGSMSGEHGDGLARSEFNRKMFGETLYQAFCRVKAVFDPNNILNPGKVVHAPAMTESLRYGNGYAPRTPLTVFDYSAQEGFVAGVEMCNGNGACRKLEGGTMCPSFRATCDEKDSTRGRANALRRALAGERPERDLRSRWVYDVLDLCLMCKACKSECPSNVDMAKLKAEFLQLYYRGRLRPLGHHLMARIGQLNRLGAPFAPLVNWLQEAGLSRWLLEKAAGFDRRRSLPRLHADHFRRWFAWHRPAPQVGRRGKVLLLDDCFTTFNEPEIGKAAVRLLEAAGYRVELAGLCCGRPMISKGMLHSARRLALDQLPRLAKRVADGTPILGLEPSCILTLADEWLELAPGPDARRVAAAAQMADVWLARQAADGQYDIPLSPQPGTHLVHVHCHQKALLGVKGTTAALKLVPGLEMEMLDAGCCGMAGSFGYEREHYDLSVKVANLALLPALKAAPDATVVAPGTSCRHQIKDLDGRRALHPLEVLAAGLPEP